MNLFVDRKVNSADCVDMDCDAKKKCMVKDLDGSLFGTAKMTAIPQSEWEWNGDPRRGLGDYRIPKTLLTDLQGNRIPVEEIAPHKGEDRRISSHANNVMKAGPCLQNDPRDKLYSLHSFLG